MASSLLGLAPGGGYLAIHITADAGGLLHHLFTITLTSCEVNWLFVSVALVRQVSSSRRVPRPGCYPTPCSMECGLSSIPTTQDRDRPTDLRRHYDTRNEAERQRYWRIFKQFSYWQISAFLTEYMNMENHNQKSNSRAYFLTKVEYFMKQAVK